MHTSVRMKPKPRALSQVVVASRGRQKGTGRARQGSSRSAQWKGGGKIHTPHMRSYVQAMPHKMRQAALRSALSVKAAESMIIVVDELKVTEPKTRLMASALNTLVGESSVLLIIPTLDSYEAVVRSTNNYTGCEGVECNLPEYPRFDGV